MYKTKSAKSKELLADALQELVGEVPLEEITVKDVTARAGLNRNTFYYHFSSLSELFDYVCATRITALSEYPEEGRDLRATFEAILLQVDENRQFYRALLLHAERRSLKSLLHESAHCALAGQFDRITGPGASDTPQGRRIVEYGVLASASAIESWVLGETELSIGELASWLADTFGLLASGFMNDTKETSRSCVLAGDQNGLGMEPAAIGGVYAANRVLGKTAD